MKVVKVEAIIFSLGSRTASSSLRLSDFRSCISVVAFGVDFNLDKSASSLSKLSLMLSTLGIEGLILSHTAMALLSLNRGSRHGVSEINMSILATKILNGTNPTVSQHRCRNNETVNNFLARHRSTFDASLMFLFLSQWSSLCVTLYCTSNGCEEVLLLRKNFLFPWREWQRKVQHITHHKTKHIKFDIKHIT